MLQEALFWFLPWFWRTSLGQWICSRMVSKLRRAGISPDTHLETTARTPHRPSFGPTPQTVRPYEPLGPRKSRTASMLRAHTAPIITSICPRPSTRGLRISVRIAKIRYTQSIAVSPNRAWSTCPGRSRVSFPVCGRRRFCFLRLLEGRGPATHTRSAGSCRETPHLGRRLLLAMA